MDENKRARSDAILALFEVGKTRGTINEADWWSCSMGVTDYTTSISHHRELDDGSVVLMCVECNSVAPLSFRWESALHYDRIEGFYVRHGGASDTLADAVMRAMAQTFEKERFDGQLWFAKTNGWTSYFGENQVAHVSKRCNKFYSGEWEWSRPVPPGDAAALVAFCKGNEDVELRGYCNTWEEAITAANRADTVLKSLAAALLSDSSFQAGRDAAKSEIRALINSL